MNTPSDLFNLYESYRGIYEASRGVEKGLNASVEYVLDYLIDEGYTTSYESAAVILESMSDEWLEGIIEGWRPANTGRMSTQAARLEKQGEPHYKVLDAAIRHLSATRTKPPTEGNLDRRIDQTTNLQAQSNKAHGTILRQAREKDMRNPQAQQDVKDASKKISNNAVKKKIIKVVTDMQTRRTPEQQRMQSAVNQFDQIFHRK